MKKKLIIIFLIILSIFFSISNTFSSCSFKEWWDVSSSLDWCISSIDVVKTGKLDLEWGGFKTVITKWTNTIAIVLWVLAVGSIVYGALLMTLSHWQEDKITKAKSVIKWWMLGFLWVISASAIITLIIRIMYSL